MGRPYQSHLEVARVDEGFWEAKVKAGETHPPEPKIKIKFACGDNSYVGWNSSSIVRDGSEPSCPKCSAAWGRLKLAEAGGRARMERDTEAPGYYRSCWRAYVDGELVGYIAMQHGYNATWEMLALTLEGEDVAPKREGLGRSNRYGVHSKEACLVKVMKARLEGEEHTRWEGEELKRWTQKLRSESELRTERVEYRRLQGVWAKERAERDAQAAEDKATAIAALESLWEKGGLSNLERSGLMIVGARYGLDFSKK